jgi:predicted HTH domain antitoxin
VGIQNLLAIKSIIQESNMRIAIDFPNDFLMFQGPTFVAQEIRIVYALWLYQQARVTLAKAAQLAEMDIYEFMQTCKANHVPVIDIRPEELAEELKGLDSA